MGRERERVRKIIRWGMPIRSLAWFGLDITRFILVKLTIKLHLLGIF